MWKECLGRKLCGSLVGDKRGHALGARVRIQHIVHPEEVAEWRARVSIGGNRLRRAVRSDRGHDAVELPAVDSNQAEVGRCVAHRLLCPEASGLVESARGGRSTQAVRVDVDVVDGQIAVGAVAMRGLKDNLKRLRHADRDGGRSPLWAPIARQLPQGMLVRELTLHSSEHA